jgi:predicted Zn-dependent peptidase
MRTLTRLENGLRVLTVTMPHVQSVSLGFFMGVGSRYESAQISGAAHFIEHMLFKGTRRWPTARDVAEAIEGRGGLFNASTGLETTLYWAKVAAGDVPQAMDVLGDMLLAPTFDPVELEKERAVIAEEINYALDAPDSLAQILVGQLQWPDHPLGRDVAGTRETVADISRGSLLAFLASYYLPGATILALAGRVSHEDALALAERYLGGWTPGSLQSWEPAPPDHRGPSLHVEFRPTEQAHLAFAFGGLARSDPRRFAARLLNVILGEGMRSRLFQEVRERLGLAYSVDSWVSTLQDTGSVGIYAGVGIGRVEEAIRAILGQLDLLRQEPVPEDELLRAKQFIRGRLLLSLEDSFAVGGWYAQQELLGPEVLEPEESLARLDAVQANDLQDLAADIFQEARLNLAIVGPFSQGGDPFRAAIIF